jgi:hypothetical protein
MPQDPRDRIDQPVQDLGDRVGDDDSSDDDASDDDD